MQTATHTANTMRPVHIRGFVAPRAPVGVSLFMRKMSGVKPGLTTANPSPDRMRFDVLMHGVPLARVVCSQSDSGVTVLYNQSSQVGAFRLPTMEWVSGLFAALTWAVMPGMSINRMTELMLNEYRNQLELIDLVGE